MKKIRLLIGTSLILPLISFNLLPVYAVESTTTTTPTTTDTTTQTRPPTSEEVAKKLADMKMRLAENKAALKTKLDTMAVKRITTKCKAAQGLVKGAETSANAISTNRAKAYTKISEAVQKLIDKLKANGKDTTEIEAAQAVAKTKADALSAAMTTYELTLSDLHDMDCATDPTTFQATLEKARTQREAIKVAATDLRTYISTTLKAAINKLKTQAENSATKTGGAQ